MITKFFNHGTGEGSAPINYLLGKNRDREDAQILKGNADLTIKLIDTAPGKHKYTSGVLSFEEHISDEVADQIMNEYEKWFTADHEIELNFLFVKHTDKDRTELHFIIPNLELTSGRSLNPHIHKLDLHGIDALKDKINAQFELADPNSPDRKRLTRSADDYLKQSKDRKELISSIDKHLSELVAEHIALNETWTQKETIEALKNLGFKISRATKTSVSISHPELKKNIRLKGGLYESNCKLNSKSETEIERDSERYKRDCQLRIEQATTEYRASLSKRRERFRERYKNSTELQKRDEFSAKRDNKSIHKTNEQNNISIDNNNNINSVDIVLNSTNTNKILHKTRSFKNTIRTARSTEKERFTDKKRQQNLYHDASKNDIMQDVRRSDNLRVEVIEVFFKGKKLGEILDSGEGLEAVGMSDKAAAFNLIKEAKKKGWKSVEIEGTDEFARNAMILALKNNIEVLPINEFQENLLNELKKEVTENDRVRENAYKAVENADRASREFSKASRKLSEASRNFEQRNNNFTTTEGLKMGYNNELERFKTEIPIQDYLENQGWTIDKKKSSKKHAVLSDGNTKVVVSRNENGHYIFFDVNTNKGGSIIDLVQFQQNINLGQVRKELRGWIGGGIFSFPIAQNNKDRHLEKSSFDERENEHVILKMTNEFNNLHSLNDTYLRQRSITISDDLRFSNLRTDEKNNVCFPHYNNGIVGWELKNDGFTGYSKGGKKIGLYATTNFSTAEKVVIVESGIDALSHAQLFKTDEDTAYVSIGGNLTQSQLNLLTNALKDKKVIVATDNDEAGNKYAKTISQHLNIKREKAKSKDWNDDLKEKTEQERVAARSYEMEM